MLAIVGLGNPGEKYKNNRHNVGFQFVDYVIDSGRSTLDFRSKNEKTNFPYLRSTVYHLKSDLILVKPQTFMNKSGEAVKKITVTYNLQPANLIVVHDDLDIPLGKFKIQKGTGPQLHNGIESIENHLHSADFWRIRIGVDNRTPEKRIDGETYVLQDFVPQELQTTSMLFPLIIKRLQEQSLI